MERLTYRGHNGKGYIRNDGYYNHVSLQLARVAEQLTTYEDTGLEPGAFLDAMQEFANHQMELTYYRDIGTTEELRALKDAEQKRREGCDKCREVEHLFWYKQSDYTRCPHCGRDLRGESHDDN